MGVDNCIAHSLAGSMPQGYPQIFIRGKIRKARSARSHLLLCLGITNTWNLYLYMIPVLQFSGEFRIFFPQEMKKKLSWRQSPCSSLSDQFQMAFGFLSREKLNIPFPKTHLVWFLWICIQQSQPDWFSTQNKTWQPLHITSFCLKSVLSPWLAWQRPSMKF